MTTYNTGNPIGSAAVRDLYDNAENLDELVNSQDKVSHPDRLGVPRKTWHGMEVDFTGFMDTSSQEFQQFLLSSGYEDLGDYQAGLEITARNQIFRFEGELYRAAASIELPYTTTGVWADESGNFVSVGDAALRQELGSGSPAGGASLVALSSGGTVQDAINYVTLEQFRNPGDPDDNWQAAINAAVASGLPIRLGARRYRATTMPLRDYMTLSGVKGESILTLVNPNDNVFTDYVGRTGLRFSNFIFEGSDTLGSSDPLLVSRSVRFDRLTDSVFESVETDTFILCGLRVGREEGRSDWIIGGDYNSQASVNALLALSSRNITFRNITARNTVSSADIQIFGGVDILIDNPSMNSTASALSILVDDASTAHLLEDYAINDNVRVIGGYCEKGVSINGCASGEVSTVTPRVLVRSYDFDQQKAAIPISPNYNGEPFLYMRRMPRRGVRVHGSQTTSIFLRAGGSGASAVNNTITQGAYPNLIECGNNGILWPDNSTTYWDSRDPAVRDDGWLDCGSNTYVATSGTVVGLGNYPTQPHFAVLGYNSKFVEAGGTFSTRVDNPSANWKWSESYPSSFGYKVSGDQLAVGVGTPRDSGDFGGSIRTGNATYRPNSANQSGDVIVPPGQGLRSATSVLGTDQGSFVPYTTDGNTLISNRADGGRIRFQTGSNGSVSPLTDSAIPLGDAAYRWSQVYAATGTINTSDARDKKTRPFTPEETAAAVAMSKEGGTVYQWLAAIDAKGDSARLHIGMTVQRAIEIMGAHGLDPFAYGFICYDQWDDAFVEHPAVTKEVSTGRYDESGADIMEAVEVTPAWTEQVQWAGDRYSFRMDELRAFIAAGINARLLALESL